MDIDEKLSQTNTFAGGMDTDTSDMLMKDSQYRLANNLRYVTNIEENTGELHMIDGAKFLNKLESDDIQILATATIRNYGVIIWKNLVSKYNWGIDYIKDTDTTPVRVFEYGGNRQEDVIGDHPSIVCRWEDNDNIKVYIADGIHELMMVSLNDDYRDDPIEHPDEYKSSSLDKIQAHSNMLLTTPLFCGFVEGSLKAGLVQYAYMLYRKHGKWTNMSPITKLIPLPKNPYKTGKSIEGAKLGKETTCGIKLKINIEDNENFFDRILLYRIHYIQAGQIPTVELIVDKQFDKTNKSIIVQDSGQDALDSLTLEEFNNLSGLRLIPKVIESKNDYLFAANIKDNGYVDILKMNDGSTFDARSFQYKINSNTLQLYNYNSKEQETDITNTSDCWNDNNDVNHFYDNHKACYTKFTDGDVQYYGGTGKYIDWKFIITEVDGDTCRYTTSDQYYDQIGTRYNIQSLKQANGLNDNFRSYYIDSNGSLIQTQDFNKHDVGISNDSNSALSYANPIVAYSLKSLRRGEVYRYGIVFYDKSNNASPVQWIADIRVPDLFIKGFQTFVSHARIQSDNNQTIDLGVRPVGIQFVIKQFPKDAAAYEIVRCNRTEHDIASLTQGVVSRPIKRINGDEDTATEYPYTPSGLLTTNKIVVSKRDEFSGHEDGISHEGGSQADNIENSSVFQFISPEVLYLKDTITAQLEDKVLQLEGLTYIYGRCAGIRTQEFLNRVHSEYGESAGIYQEQQSSYGVKTKHIIKPSVSNLNIGFGVNNKISEVNDIDAYRTTVNILTEDLTKEFYKAQPSDGKDNSKSTPSCIIPTEDRITAWPYFADYGINTGVKTYNADSTYKVRFDVYAYIKLYEQCPNVLLSMPIDDQRGKYFVIKDDKIQQVDSAVYYPQTHFECKINNINMASDLNWDDGVTDTESDGKSAVTSKYIDKEDAIGRYRFNNWVSWNRYGDSQYDEMLRFERNGYASTDREALVQKVIMGPGGRCLLLNTDYNACLTDTIGSASTTIVDYDNYPSVKYVNADRNKEGVQAELQQLGSTIYAESALGTYLCNIKHNVFPYGGSSYTDRQLSNYYSYGDYHIIGKTSSQQISVFDGDCFIEPLEYTSMHKWYSKTTTLMYAPTFAIIYSIPVETNINLALSDGFEFSRNYKQNNVTNLQSEPANVNGLLIQEDPGYSYNSAYSQNPTSKVFASDSENLYESSMDNFDYRIFYSQRKDNNERRDNWLVFMPANFLDVDTRYGQITELKRFHNNLLFWQEEASGLLSVDERVQISDDSNLPLILGTGGVLSRYDYFSSKNGMAPYEYADAQSDAMLIWYDRYKNELCSYSGDGTNISILSKAKFVQNFFNKNNKFNTEGCLISYDKQFNEFIINVIGGVNKQNGSLVYNELMQTFIGLYTIRPYFDFEFKDRLLFIDKYNNISEWNNGNGQQALGLDDPYLENTTDEYKFRIDANSLYPFVEYTVNKNPQMVKVFDQAEMGGRFYGGDNLSRLGISFSTPLKQYGYINGDKITNREYSFRYTVPRNSLNSIPAWGKRLRGKTMQVELTSNSNSTDFSLQYVTTKFRLSWS